MSALEQAGGPLEWRANWTVVLAAFLGVGLMSVPTYSNGVFIAPLEAEFGWSRTQIASGMLLSTVVGAGFAPLLGLAVDRFGPRRIGMAGALVMCAALIGLSRAGPSLWSWWAAWAFVAVAALLMKPVVWTAAVSSLFVRTRGTAIAVTLMGTALGSAVAPVLCAALIERYGWRLAYVGLSLSFAVVVLPVLFLFFTSARDQRRSRPVSASVQPPPQLEGVTARQGLTSFRFYRLLLAAMVMALVATNLIANLPPILASFGHPRMTAASAASVAGLSTIIGRLAGGYLLDRFNGNVVAGTSVLLPIGSCLMLLSCPHSEPVVFAAAALAGLCIGAEFDAVAYLVTRHFGMRSFGVLFGTMSGALALANGLGPVLVSQVYDVTKSYTPAIWALIPLSLLGAVLFYTLGGYPRSEAQAITAAKQGVG